MPRNSYTRPMTKQTEQNFWQLHTAACERGEPTYVDPNSGFNVFTEVGLRARGSCCGAGCRHCPYAHEGVPLAARGSRAQQPAWLTDTRPTATKTQTVLFSSGGKDSYLTHRALARAAEHEIVWLTTYDVTTRRLAHQDIHIDDVLAQAHAVGTPLIGVPLHSGPDYVEQLIPALKLVPNIAQLAFGDLHLTHIRQWRETAFASHPATRDVKLAFPLWHVPYAELTQELEASGVTCEVSAVTVEQQGLQLGARVDQKFLLALPEAVDAFGENGEYHTLIRIPAIQEHGKHG